MSFSFAGDLNPPAGPIAPTHKTLTQVEPRTPIGPTTTSGDSNSLFRIAQPGSYYLTSNIAGVAAFRGIEIASSDVTIDLNGFTMTGVAGSLQGIATDGTRSGIVIRNGSVNSWGLSGIDLLQGGGTGAQHRIEDVRAAANGSVGFNVGNQSIVRDCIALSNVDSGYVGAFACSFEGCTARFNGERGFQTSSGARFERCAAVQSTLDGFFVTGECMLRDCLAYLNSGNGVETNDAASIIGCTIEGNTEHGLFIDDDCSVIDCVIRDNDLNGIFALTGCVVTGCTISESGLHGVSSAGGGRIVGNICRRNGLVGVGAGITISGADHHVEDNTVSTNDFGIQATTAGNFIARNTASGNTTLNWDIVAGNKCFVVLGVDAAAISGDSGGVSPGSTNPNANYTY